MSMVSNTTSTTNPYLVAYSTNDLSGSDTTASKYSASSTSGSKGGSVSSTDSYSQGLVSQMSGLDTNSLVNESMASDVIQLNNLLAKEQKSQWTQDRYQSIISSLENFSSQYFDPLSSNYILSPNSFGVNVANSSSSNILSTSASNTAEPGTYTVTSAVQATVASINTGALTNSSGQKAADSDAISTMGVSSGTISFSIGGNNISYNLQSTSSINSVMQDLSSLTGLNFNYSELTGKFSISTQKTGSSQNIDIENISDPSNFFTKFGLSVSGNAIATTDTARIDGTGVIQSTDAAGTDEISDTNLSLTNGETLSFTINGKAETYTVDTSKSVNTLMSDLSSLTGSTFSYNSSTGKISAKSAGSSLNISYANGSGTQTFFNNAFGEPSGTTSMTSAAGTSEIDGSSIIENPSRSAISSASDSIYVTKLPLTNGDTLSFNVNGVAKTYTVDTSKSIGTLMSDLSSLTGSTFSYNSSTGKVSVEATGSQSFSMSYANGSSAQTFFNNIFGEAAGTTSIAQTSSSASQGTSGTNGTFTIMEPGDTTGTTVSEASNNFTIDGVSYNFSGDTSSVSSSNPITVSVKQDVSSAVSKIQNFVSSYNDLIDAISSVTNEQSDPSYAPLTSSQESQMTQTQITAWNQKAQQGLLSNDSTLTDMLSEMREAFYTPVNGNGLTMGGIGLSTSDDPTQGGKITINVAQLTQSLQNNPQGVINLFNKASTSYPGYDDALDADTTTNSSAVTEALNQRNSEEGIFQRLSDIEQKYAGTYIDKNGNQGILIMKAGAADSQYSATRNTLYNTIKDEATDVADFKTQMQQDAARYTQKYSALQAALSQLSTQQNYLSSMLGSSSSSS